MEKEMFIWLISNNYTVRTCLFYRKIYGNWNFYPIDLQIFDPANMPMGTIDIPEWAQVTIFYTFGGCYRFIILPLIYSFLSPLILISHLKIDNKFQVDVFVTDILVRS